MHTQEVKTGWIRRWIGVTMVAFSALLLSAGCNTIEGAGEDISAAGDAIDESAEDAN